MSEEKIEKVVLCIADVDSVRGIESGWAVAQLAFTEGINLTSSKLHEFAGTESGSCRVIIICETEELTRTLEEWVRYLFSIHDEMTDTKVRAFLSQTFEPGCQKDIDMNYTDAYSFAVSIAEVRRWTLSEKLQR